MAFWNRKKKEQRSLENPQIPISSENIIKMFGADMLSAAGVTVNPKTALEVPAIWAAVNFIAGTIAGLPLHVYRKTEDGKERIKGGLATILHDAVTPEMSSFDWRKYFMERTLTDGRSVSFIERNAMGRVLNIWPLVSRNVSVSIKGGRKFYEYREGSRKVIYDASDVIDIPFMLDDDMATAISPVLKNADAIGLAIAATKYGSKFFNNGGVPPFALVGNFQTGAAMRRASEDLEEAVKRASTEGRTALTLPSGHTLERLGVDPDKAQLSEIKRFSVEEIARIYQIPPTFLQDLTNGTFSNTEQQDLHFVKHTVKRWVEQIEQELNLKLFGRSNTSQFAEFNVDGLLRGDFTTRMEGYSKAIQNAVMTPNEARQTENRPNHEKGDDLMIQGATVPLGEQPMKSDNTEQPPTEEPSNDDGNASG